MDKKVITLIIGFIVVVAVVLAMYFLRDGIISDEELPEVEFLEEEPTGTEIIEARYDDAVDLEQARTIAREWVKEHGSTYRERGKEDSLTFVDKKDKEEGIKGFFEITFEFEAIYAGYGRMQVGDEVRRTGEIREIVVYTYHDHILAGIVDDVYDDLNLAELDEELEVYLSLRHPNPEQYDLLGVIGERPIPEEDD